MKKYIISIVIILIVSTLSAQWVRQLSGGQGAQKKIQFIDENHGWVIGNPYSWMIGTRNGGYTWLPCEISGTSVFFVNHDKGWVGDGPLWHTENGGIITGSNWEIQFDPPFYAIGSTSLFFSDTLHGWYVGSYTLPNEQHKSDFFHTNDEGNNWLQDITMDGWVADIDFLDSLTGWAIFLPDYGGGLIHTSDGGKSWNTISTTTGNSLCFISPMKGWVASSNNPDNGQILHTNDGGYTWEQQTGDSLPPLNDIVFIDSLVGWGVGDGGTIIHTKDGGVTWEYQDSETEADLYGVSFVGYDLGWICGDSGIVLHTNNGGIVGFNEMLDKKNIMSVFPNPASTSTKIVFEFQKSEEVTFFVYDVRGVKVKQLPLGKMNIGEIELDCSNLLPGIYIIKIVAGVEKLTERIVIE